MRLAFLFLTISTFWTTVFAQNTIHGVVTGGIPLENATVQLLNTEYATTTDQLGHYKIQGVPNGKYTFLIKYVGYNELKVQVVINDQNTEFDFELETQWKELGEVVITGSKTRRRKGDSPLYVSVLGKANLESTNSINLAEGLNFTSGLRVETNCQTCGYSQLRINGLGGAYSQVLLNSRPVFNSLIGLYGLEQFPTQVIEQIEVLKGGTSATYGSSAIAGSVNIITKPPESDQLNLQLGTSLINNQSLDRLLTMDFSKNWGKSGISVFYNNRNREAYDHNNDGFTELPRINANSLGVNSSIKTGKYSDIKLTLAGINETRRGGNKLDLPPHKADQAEDREHNIFFATSEFNQVIPSRNIKIGAYLAGQITDRSHYTGVDMVDAYGTTASHTFNGGLQLSHFLKNHTLSYGIDYMLDYINDEIPGYNYLIDQEINLLGVFVQEEWKINHKTTLLVGGRLDQHSLMNNLRFSPRINLLQNLGNFSQFRAYYSQGYRAPQAFDADLHIAFAGGGIAYTVLDPSLKPEYSHSAGLTYSFDKPSEKQIYGFTLDVFYTSLTNTFVLENSGEDENGNTILLKTNGLGSHVAGITAEGRWNIGNIYETSLGFTAQQSIHDEPIQWSEQVQGERRYLRTPDFYGFMLNTVTINQALSFSLNAAYTGAMIVPLAAVDDPEAPNFRPNDELRETPHFLSADLLVNYKIPLKKFKGGIEVSGGVKNVFNSYQSDFDTGKYRDSNYVYGPALPRQFLINLRFGVGS